MNRDPQRVLLEICIASVEDAITAEQNGADRLELNAALALGGLTPSLGTLMPVKRKSTLPVMVMIRPRPAGFCYSALDFQVMINDAQLALQHGADGIVFGILKENGTVDIARCREFLRAIGPAQVVFHRAFDVTLDPFEALEQLIDLGIHRVLTSGQAESAVRGADLLRRLVERAAGRIEILPAAGINPSNVADVLTRTGCWQIHCSLREKRTDRSTSARPELRFGKVGSECDYDGSSAELIAEMRKKLGSVVRRPSSDGGEE